MRVLFLATYFPRPSIPLAGTWALEQAKALARVVDLEVLCCTPWVPSLFHLVPRARPWIEVPPSYQWDGVGVRYLKTLYYPIPPFNAWSFPDPQRQMSLAWSSVRRRLLERVLRFRPEVLFCHHAGVSGYFAHRIAEHTGIPYITADHDFAEIARCQDLPRRKAFYEPILRRAWRSVCVSRRMEADMLRIFPLARTETLHNGVQLPSADTLGRPRPQSLADKTIILSSGMFTERKGFPLLVEAFGRIAHKHPAAILRIAGDGRDRPSIEAAIARQGLHGRVQLLGLLPHEEVLREMAWCDFFALVSWDEPFGVVYAEAMSATKPVVVASDAGIVDLVRDGVHGRVVPPKDVEATAAALDRLLSDPSERRRMGKEAEELVRNRLTWQENCRRLVEIFRAAIEIA